MDFLGVKVDFLLIKENKKNRGEATSSPLLGEGMDTFNGD